ncbi:hypothetical protein [Rhodococcus sp. UNC363MFTsu5.1]|uniref:hypothetical protein n=1 Tax=Rhodococcus sp. UNC363MFTsu5.1 TaxID=1449069 RepID=UPI00047FDCA0|nr:hypothetical protein [Rhodococcus sp. UNC363MFTsu5.1]
MQIALLSGAFALTGVLIAQCIVLLLARRTDRRRSDPELLKQCAKFSSAAGRFKRDISTKPREDWDFGALDMLEDASDSIDIIGTPEIERAAERLIGYVPLVLEPEVYGVDPKDARRGIYDAHREFTGAVRKYFHKPPKVYMAVPIIERPNSSGQKQLQAD